MHNKIPIFNSRHFLISILTVVVYTISLSIYANTKKENQHCLVSVANLKKTNNTFFVDVRNNKIFNKNHIPGSINIPLNLIKTKSFLKNKELMLVGNGWNEPSLIQKCIQLKGKGFKSVRVLTGGIISWFKKQKKPSNRILISLTAKEFFNNKMEKKFVPFVISDSTKKQINTILPHAKINSPKVTKKQLLNRLNRVGKGNNPIVIFSKSNRIVDAAINDYLRQPPRKMYYFEGGFDTYQKVNALNKMTALSNKGKRLSTKKPVSCAN